MIGVGKRRRGAWPDHHLMLGVSLAMSADSEDLDRLVTTRQQTSGRTVTPPTSAPRRQAPAMEPEQIMAARLPERRSGSEGANTTRDAPSGSPIDHGQRCETSSFGSAAANDPSIKSSALVAPHHDTTSREATQGGSGKLPGSPIERRRSDRRHIARRRDDGQPGYWRRDDRRTVERRMHARPDLTIADTDAPWPAASPARTRDHGAIRVLIVSQRPGLAVALVSGLTVEPDLHVVSACRANGRDIRTAAAHSPVDLVLFDTALVALCGVACLADLRAVACDAKFVLLWDEAHPLAVEEIERQGIRGCIPLLAPARHYVRAIREVSRGGLWLPRWIMNRVCGRVLARDDSQAVAVKPAATGLPALTAREQAIATRVAAGKTNKEIATELNVSPDTVKKHLGSIFDKIGVHRRSQLAYSVAASQQGSPRPE